MFSKPHKVRDHANFDLNAVVVYVFICEFVFIRRACVRMVLFTSTIGPWFFCPERSIVSAGHSLARRNITTHVKIFPPPPFPPCLRTRSFWLWCLVLQEERFLYPAYPFIFLAAACTLDIGVQVLGISTQRHWRYFRSLICPSGYRCNERVMPPMLPFPCISAHAILRLLLP